MTWNFFRSRSGGSRRSSPEAPRSSRASSIGSGSKRNDPSTDPTRRRANRDSPSSSTRTINALLVSEMSSRSSSKPTRSPAKISAEPARGQGRPNRTNMRRNGRSGLDPESDPLRGLGITVTQSTSKAREPMPKAREPRAFQPASKRISSVHSMRSNRSVRSGHSARSGFSSSRSILSGSVTARARSLKSSRMAKHAMAALIASNGGNPLKCYTCEHEFNGLRCDRCRTAYLPPGFIFSAAAALNGGAAMVSGATEPSTATSDAGSNVSVSGVSLSGAASYVGVVPDLGDDLDADRTIDFELISDLATCNDYGLLEAVVFDYFSSISTVTRTFCKCTSANTSDNNDIDDGSSNESLLVDGTVRDHLPNRSSSSDAETTGSPFVEGISGFSEGRETDPSDYIDTAAVNKLYSILGSVSSTGPMRGILQGAEAILLTRKHAPVTEEELVYICVILQCPAIVDCSMFTKIMGPMQKLARYASLRSRARMLLEVCSGLIVNSDESMHPMVVNHLATLEPTQFADLVDLCNAYISHRLLFHFQYKSGANARPTRFQQIRLDWYADDWRIIVVVKFLSMLWAANQALRANKSGMPIFAFYNTMVDQVALQDDYDSWQVTRSRKKPRFCFCRYPHLLSAGSKAKIFEHAIKREVNSAFQREMFTIMADPHRSRSLENQQMQIAALRTIVLKVRRTHLFSDSLEQLQKWQVSKRRDLRVEFDGEQGIDAGGLKREWCLMFYRQLLDPASGAFVIDETSNYCWFGTHPDLNLYSSAGMVLGLALFNSITIDLNLPLLLFKLLLDKPYNLEDVATLWPEIAQSLQSILDYDADEFEETFGLTFTAPDGTALIPDGESQPVTSSSRELYVELLVGHLVNQNGSSPQFRAFKKSFLDTCGCNALNLFEPEELELLVRGDRKPIDVLALRSVTKYVNFGHRFETANKEPVVNWFWDYFQSLDPQAQAKLMRFVTATDRIPAAGMVNMRFSIMCLGSDSNRLPIAHTCFNQLCLYKYSSKRKLEQKLSLAVAECQGFGLK